MSDNKLLVEQLQDLANTHENLAQLSKDLAQQVADFVGPSSGALFFVNGLTIFILAIFVGYYVVWRVTPALHSPLMAVTNAISSVIIVGALIATGPAGDLNFAKWMGFFAVTLASINIFGGFIVTHRMLSMFKKKEKKPAEVIATTTTTTQSEG